MNDLSTVTKSTVTRLLKGHTYEYDPIRKLYFNPETDKWVQNPIVRQKKVASLKHRYFHPQVDPLLRTITRNTNKLESIQYVLKVINHTHAKLMCRDENEEELNGEEFDPAKVYAWCHSELFTRLLGNNYTKVMKAMVVAGILEHTVKIDEDITYQLYRLKPQYRTGFMLLPISSKNVDKKVSTFYRNRASLYHPLSIQIGEHLALNIPRIDLDEPRFRLLWNSRYFSSYLPRHPPTVDFIPRTHEQYMKIADYLWRIIDHWNTADFEEKAAECSDPDKFGGRIHHLFTKLPKEIRAYLVGRDGKKVEFIEYDLVNAQPAIFANLLVTQFDLVPDEHLFIRLVEEKQIYEDMAQRMNITRDAAKVEMMRYMYCKPFRQPQRDFEKYYGLPAQFARKYKIDDKDSDGNLIDKKVRYKQLCKMMQRAESTMFSEVWVKLLRMKVLFIPVHDAIYVAGTNERSQRYIEDIIEETLKKHFQIKFKLKAQKIIRQNLFEIL